MKISDFITRWSTSAAAERANYQLFLCELCELLDVPKPDPSKAEIGENEYVFEYPVKVVESDGSSTTTFADLYKRGHFVLEAKQGSEKKREAKAQLLSTAKKAAERSARKGTAVRGTTGWDDAMLAARAQAEVYAKHLPLEDGWPPFIVVVDVGHSIELYADFSRSGKTYLAFPDSSSHRIFLKDLERAEVQERLRKVWSDPLSLDPSKITSKVTREVAAKLAELAKSFEASGYESKLVAQFLMRCLFTMFAEDVGLLPKNSFLGLLEARRERLETFPQMIQSLWQAMDKGEYSPALDTKVLRFNGELFSRTEVLPVNADQLELLIEAAKADWRNVEPAIFGTLLERALDPIERHRLGAHYTPRAYVERLVLPTIIEPLRAEWENVKTAAVVLAKKGKLAEAAAEAKKFLQKLCETKVLDPACGTGNFLYVTLEQMKVLEGEVRDIINSFNIQGKIQVDLQHIGFTVDPHQFLGIEINHRAAGIAELVIWIGYLQWHFRTFGATPPAEPIIKAFKNIECRDALLDYDSKELVLDEATGKPLSRWDGRTMKKHPVTGEDVPDDSARVPIYRYVNAKKATWPQAEFVVGNPPFIGNWRMRDALGDGYTETVRAVYDDVPESCDYVMYWWDKAGELLQKGKISRFGLITTNSIRQTFSRKILQKYLAAKKPASLVYAIPDHPWVDASDGAAVRIAMTVATAGSVEGRLGTVVEEVDAGDGASKVTLDFKNGNIQGDLTVGANVAQVGPLEYLKGICSPGVKLHGAGFILTEDEANAYNDFNSLLSAGIVRHYKNGKDLAQTDRQVYVIDFFGLSQKEAQIRSPKLFQRVLERVKPERDFNNMKSRREKWWLFGTTVPLLRKALKGLPRFISTPETAKHRFFVFLDEKVLPDNMLVNIALSDAFFLGVLSSRIHVTWSLAAGGRLGIGNDPRYNKTRCFDPYPFPLPTEQQKQRIRELGEQLDAHRKRQQAEHPKLTLTDMYNVLEKLRSGEALTAKEKVTHEQGLVSVLKQIHDDLDKAVFEAYGWPENLTDEEILERLVALNKQRAADEARGIIHYLRPEYQNPAASGAPKAAAPTQTTLDVGGDDDDWEAAERTDGKSGSAKSAATKTTKLPWPKTLAEQVTAVKTLITSNPDTAPNPTALAKHFTRGNAEKIEEIVETLRALGQV